MHQTSPLIAICVATYLRPRYLRSLLKSIEKIETVGFQSHLIIVDNDVNGSAQPVVNDLIELLPLPVTYLIEPTRGIAIARNKLVEAANTIGADYVAFVDDDQFVDPDWLRYLLDTAQAMNVDAVGGRWIAYYQEGVPGWFKSGNLRNGDDQTPTGTRVVQLNTGGVLIRLAAMNMIPGPFDVRDNMTGGEDYQFFEQFNRLGYVSVKCRESIVYERIPASRATAPWYIKRQFRYGVDKAVRYRRSAPSPSRIRTGVFLAGIFISSGKHSFLLVPRLLLRGRAGIVRSIGAFAYELGCLVGLVGMTYKEYSKTHGE